MKSSLNAIAFACLNSLLFAAPPIFSQDAAAPPAKASNDAKPAMQWKRFDYTCDAGAKLTVFLHDNSVKVRFKDNTYLMRQVLSADGGRYSDGKVVWWSVGHGGFLQEDSPDGNGAMIVKDCKLDKPMSGAASTSSVTGTVSYRVRIALPPTAVIQVQLLDVSLADAPDKMLAEEKITLGNRQVPVPFTLKFDPARLDQRHTYSVSARISVDGELRFKSDTAYLVLTRGNPNRIDVLVKQVTPPTSPAKP
jgi:putative lipoprotein